jgi:hypothetical protein
MPKSDAETSLEQHPCHAQPSLELGLGFSFSASYLNFGFDLVFERWNLKLKIYLLRILSF